MQWCQSAHNAGRATGPLWFSLLDRPDPLDQDLHHEFSASYRISPRRRTLGCTQVPRPSPDQSHLCLQKAGTHTLPLSGRSTYIVVGWQSAGVDADAQAQLDSFLSLQFLTCELHTRICFLLLWRCTILTRRPGRRRRVYSFRDLHNL
jgi:hypothetical protein